MAEDHGGLLRLGLRLWVRAGRSSHGHDARRDLIVLPDRGPGREDPPGFDRISEIRLPSVMLLGDKEYPMVAEASRAIAVRLDGCRTALVPGADHMLPLRALRRLADAIAQSAGPA